MTPTMEVESKNKTSTDQSSTADKCSLNTSNKGSLDVVKATLGQTKPLELNQLSFKQNKQTVTCDPKAAGLPFGSPLTLGKNFPILPNVSYMKNYPSTTMQNIQNYQPFQNTQMPAKLSSFFNYLPGSLIGSATLGNNTVSTKSK